MLPPTEETLDQLAKGVESKNFKWERQKQRGKEHGKQAEKGWPQVLVEQFKQFAAIKGTTKHPAKHSFNGREKSLGKRGIRNRSQVARRCGRSIRSSLFILFHVAFDMLVFSVVLHPSAFAPFALGAPMELSTINCLGSGLTIKGAAHLPGDPEAPPLPMMGLGVGVSASGFPWFFLGCWQSFAR